MKKVLTVLFILLLAIPAEASRLFDGVNDQVDFNTDQALNISGDLSWGGWVRFNSGTDDSDAIVNRDYTSPDDEAGNTCLALRTNGVSGDWDIEYYHEYNSGVDELGNFATALANDTWYYIAITRDVTAKTVKLWSAAAGGTLSLAGTFSYTNNHTGGTGSGTRYVMGSRTTLINDYDGNIAEAVYYSRQLTVDEHQQNMTGARVYGNLLLDAHLWGLSDPPVELSGNAWNDTLDGTTVEEPPPVGPILPGGM